MPYLCNLFGDFYYRVLIEFLAVDEDIRLVNGGVEPNILKKASPVFTHRDVGAFIQRDAR